MASLTHVDADGNARMVDVTDKAVTERSAVAVASVHMKPATVQMIRTGAARKGDVLGVARIAGIQAAKKCADLIPLCHPLMLTTIQVELTTEDDPARVDIRTTCKLKGQTGVEMEALTAASVAALTIYDMCKAVDKRMAITGVQLLEKTGGQSGPWTRGQQDD